MDFLPKDTKWLVSTIKKQEKQLIHKRRWLLGLPTSRRKQKNKKELDFLESGSVPESLLREDDVFPEIIRKFVEKGFGLRSTGAQSLLRVNNSLESLNPRDLINSSLSLLDDLTNIGLYKIARILTYGSLKFEKTRKKMKKLITKSLSTISENQNIDQVESNALVQISELLMDKANFRKNLMTYHHASVQFHHATVTSVLDKLEDLPFQALSAMHRKLAGVSHFAPKLCPPKSGWTNDRLLKRVRKICLQMLSEVAEGDDLQLQKPLADALTVSQLSLKLTSGNRKPTTEFYHSSPGKEVLQNDLIKAILLLRERSVSASDLKSLQLVLDPGSKVSDRSRRSAIKKMLTEYLFECVDDEPLPDSVIEALNIINKRVRKPGLFGVSDKEIDREVELVLSMSANLKQILWDSLSNWRLDDDYGDVYLDDPDEIESSNDSNEQRQGPDFEDDSTDESEFVGESDQFSCFNQEESRGSPNDHQCIKSDDPLICRTDFPGKERVLMRTEENTSRSKYLALQEVCDNTSVIAYALIGNTLAYFAREEGRNIDTYAESYLKFPIEEQATCLEAVYQEGPSGKGNGDYDNYLPVKDLIASFPQSKADKIKELLGIE